MPKPKANKPKNAVLVALGAVVRQKRKAAGYTQEAFGMAAGIDRSHMGGIERGEHNLTMLNILKIVQALNMTVDEFFKGYNEQLVNVLKAQTGVADDFDS